MPFHLYKPTVLFKSINLQRSGVSLEKTFKNQDYSKLELKYSYRKDTPPHQS